MPSFLVLVACVYQLGIWGDTDLGLPCKTAVAALAKFKLGSVANERIATIGN
jgi:hypothetical protein